MMNRLSIATAAGLLFAAPAFADDQDATRTKDTTQDQTQTQTQTQTRDRDAAKDPASAGLGAKVRVMAQDQKPGDATHGIGDQVREMARQHGCDQNGSAECKAHEAVHEALADKAGPPTERPSLPADAADKATTERRANHERTAEAERAAMRHAERRGAGKDVDDMHSNAHRAGRGDGHGMGDSNCAETKRSGDAHPMGSGSGSGSGSGMMPGGGMR